MVISSPQLNTLHSHNIIQIIMDIIIIHIIMDITMVIIKLDINMIIIEYSGGYKREDRKQNIQQMEEVTETVVEQGKVGNMQMPNQVDEYK